jgi:class 3 adenylate cyclase/tetratricopeptide (TPR) repeat protein/two-component SAPR family response regulator
VFPPIPATDDNGVVAAGPATEQRTEQAVQVRLLGPFTVALGDRVAGPWQRPSARRLCALVMLSPGRRVSRDRACEELFAGREPRAAARAVSKALSMARSTLADLGDPAADLIRADLESIWASPAVQTDLEAHEQALRAGLALAPGARRDDRLATALAADGELLADEPYADWALRPRERLEALRQEARLTLARDRASGAGRFGPPDVEQAWAACLEHDPACEEAAGALVAVYFAQGLSEAAVRTYERCAGALADLGLRTSPWLDEVYGAAAHPTGEPRSAATDRPPTGLEPAQEELRTVSVLFAGVSASPELVGELGLEGVREVVSGSLAAVATEVEALAGTVTAVSGSGLQAMFGAPRAHEDDPERAVRAAFRALAAVAGGVPALQIGVETGRAVLGPVGAAGTVEYAAIGEVVSTAAALQSRARPGGVLVGPATHAATRHLFTWGRSEDVPLGQQASTVTARYLGSPRAQAPSRAAWLSRRGKLVGRERQLGVLSAAVSKTLSGDGSIVLLIGEAGLGKTRLVQEVCERSAAAVRGKTPLWLEGRCASYASATPYGLYQQLLAGWIGVAPDQPEAKLRPALDRALAAVHAESLRPELARLMGMQAGQSPDARSPGDVQRATFAAVRSLVARLVASQPTVLVLEDLHWADPTSLRLTAQLAALASGRPLLVVATRRPDAGQEVAELERSLAAGPAMHRIELSSLPAAAAQELARSLAGEPASQEVVDAVLSGADGNPLFVEERLSLLRETGSVVLEGGRWRLRAGPHQATPQVLERLVRARVDRLSPPARKAIRVAAVLGNEFSLPVLRAMREATRGTDVRLASAVDELRARDLVHPVAGAREPTLAFRHALIQEAIYNGLLSAERRQLHGRAARALEAGSTGRIEEVAAVIGSHFAAAGETGPALRYLVMAGDHATDAFANDEAISSYRAALAVAGDQGAGAGLADAIDVHVKLANVLWRTGRLWVAGQAFEHALKLAGPSDPRRAHLLTRLGRIQMTEGQHEAAAASFDTADRLIGGEPSVDDTVSIDQWLELMIDGRAGMHVMRGEPDVALATLDAARALAEARGNPARRHSFYLYLALARVAKNQFQVAEDDIATMRKSAEAARGSDEKDFGYATYFVGRLLQLRGDLPAARTQLEKALAMAERIGEGHLLAHSLLDLTLTAIRRHDTAAVRSLAPRAMTAARALRHSEYVAEVTACLAWLAWRDRRPADVIALAGRVERLVGRGNSVVGTLSWWVCQWPLLAVHLDADRVGDAIAAAHALLALGEPQLAVDLRSPLEASSRAWQVGDHDTCRHQLAAALRRARDLRYV